MHPPPPGHWPRPPVLVASPPTNRARAAHTMGIPRPGGSVVGPATSGIQDWSAGAPSPVRRSPYHHAQGSRMSVPAPSLLSCRLGLLSAEEALGPSLFRSSDPDPENLKNHSGSLSMEAESSTNWLSLQLWLGREGDKRPTLCDCVQFGARRKECIVIQSYRYSVGALIRLCLCSGFQLSQIPSIRDKLYFSLDGIRITSPTPKLMTCWRTFTLDMLQSAGA